ncbi:hypothetical protein TESG_08195 [Trichophyton tonsurans CBS 112818]|uniref:Uncharacterized protein n=1 Tax=Trichophyton tonsurans (strain CBS 112818) TaxID=647933 RepID=F2SBF1_TRIT1|nr:hypothetical protein TESG_08195 [Trichophyton tonsurans CBS 112818]
MEPNMGTPPFKIFEIVLAIFSAAQTCTFFEDVFIDCQYQILKSILFGEHSPENGSLSPRMIHDLIAIAEEDYVTRDTAWRLFEDVWLAVKKISWKEPLIPIALRLIKLDCARATDPEELYICQLDSIDCLRGIWDRDIEHGQRPAVRLPVGKLLADLLDITGTGGASVLGKVREPQSEFKNLPILVITAGAISASSRPHSYIRKNLLTEGMFMPVKKGPKCTHCGHKPLRSGVAVIVRLRCQPMSGELLLQKAISLATDWPAAHTHMSERYLELSNIFDRMVANA